jgi:hypothetical protein
MLALLITILGNGLALTWIQVDRQERVVQQYRACLAQRERTIEGATNVILLADLAEEDGASRFAKALRGLVDAELRSDGEYHVSLPPLCTEP